MFRLNRIARFAVQAVKGALIIGVGSVYRITKNEPTNPFEAKMHTILRDLAEEWLRAVKPA